MNYLSIFQQGQSYSEYRAMIDALLAERKTTGVNHSESYLKHTEMNVRRMNRLDKRPEILPEAVSALKSIEKPMLWLVITEAWCGDAAQIIPIVERMANESPNVITRYILRDEHPEIMENFLTDGGKAIPIIVALYPYSGEALGHWGPRPKEAQEMMVDWKLKGNEPYEAFSERLHSWYAKDKTVQTQVEFKESIENISRQHTLTSA